MHRFVLARGRTGEERDVLVFMNGPVVEIFVGGMSASVALPSRSRLSLSAEVDGVAVAPSWCVIA